MLKLKRGVFKLTASTLKKKIEKYFDEIRGPSLSSNKKKISTVAGLCVYLNLTLEELKSIEALGGPKGRVIKMAKLRIAEHYENGDLPSSLCVYLNRINNGVSEEKREEEIDFSGLDGLY